MHRFTEGTTKRSIRDLAADSEDEFRRRSRKQGSDAERLLSFFRGETCGPPNLTISLCLQQSNAQLEARHDYIQWVFPSPQRSAFNDDAPVFVSEAAEEFRRDARLRRQLLQCLERMLRFYDMKIEYKQPRAMKPSGEGRGDDDDASDGSRNWARIVLDDEAYSRARIKDTILGSYSKFHNLLRLTRIMLSLKTAGLPRVALMLHRVLVEDLQKVVDIPERTLHFWGEAVADIHADSESAAEDADLESKITEASASILTVLSCFGRCKRPRTTRRKGRRRRKRLARRYERS